GFNNPEPVSFATQILPLLTKARCNSGGCHGKAEGRNGFKLSVFGFDVVADHEALVMEARGRRIFPSAPESSLLLRKATGQMSHGGGKRIAPDGLGYQLLRRWITEGARYEAVPTRRGGLEAELPPGTRHLPVVTIEVDPPQQILAFNGTQQLRVIAI